MLTIQKNDLFQAVTNAELDPAIFKVEEFERTTSIHVLTVPLVFEVMHSATSFNDLTYRYKAFAPNWPYWPAPRPKNYSQLSALRKQAIDADLKDGWRPLGNWCSFQDVVHAFASWLNEHVKPALANAAAPDLWTAAAEALPSFEDVPSEQA